MNFSVKVSERRDEFLSLILYEFSLGSVLIVKSLVSI